MNVWGQGCQEVILLGLGMGFGRHFGPSGNRGSRNCAIRVGCRPSIRRLRRDSGLSYRSISQALNIGYGTVVDYLERAERANLGWPLPEGMDERDLGRLLFPTQPRTGQRRFAEPDFARVHQELGDKSVTKQLLWQEYRQQHPTDGYSYAQFCHRYLKWLGCQQRSMRQIHYAGENRSHLPGSGR